MLESRSEFAAFCLLEQAINPALVPSKHFAQIAKRHQDMKKQRRAHLVMRVLLASIGFISMLGLSYVFKFGHDSAIPADAIEATLTYLQIGLAATVCFVAFFWSVFTLAMES